MDLGGSELVPSRRGARPGVVRRYLLLRAAADGNAGWERRLLQPGG